MTIEAPGRHVVGIQMLRGVAATMVVFVHMDTELARLHFRTLGTAWLATGVDIFFVISGFIMWTSVERRGGMSAGTFLKNRIIRIVPLYWTATTLVLLVALFAPNLVNSTVLELRHAIASFLFIPARHPVFGSFWPLLIPGWSLNYEMLFYVIFAIALLAGTNSKVTRLVVIFGIFSCVLVAANLLKKHIDVMNFYARPISLEFLAGVVLGVLCVSGKVRGSWTFVLMIAAGFWLLWAGTHMVASFAAVMAAASMIVAGTVFIPALPENPLSKLGDASYSLYLTHGMVLSASAWMWQTLRPNMSAPFFVVGALCCAIAAASICYRFFEVPVTAALKSQTSGSGHRLQATRQDAAAKPTPGS